MRDYTPFELSGPVGVYGAFYSTLAQHQRSITGVQAGVVNVAQLSEITTDLGEIRAGYFITEDLYWDNSTGTAVFDGSGVIMSGESWTTDGTNYYNLGGFNAGVLQFALSAADGAAYAGAGAVKMDEDGISLVVGVNDENHLKFIDDSDNLIVGMVEGYIAGTTTPNRQSNVTIYATAESGGTGYGGINLYATGGNANSAILKILSNPAFTGGPLQFTEPGSGQVQFIHRGATPDAFNVTLSTAPAAIITRTIEANSMGTLGKLLTRIKGAYLNNSGGSRVLSFIYTYGTESQTVAFSTQTTSATNRGVFHIEIETVHLATGQQGHVITADKHGPAATGSNAVNANDYAIWLTTTQDETADIAMKVELVSAADTATQNAWGGVEQFGPYYNA